MRSNRERPLQAATLVAAMGLYFLGAPTASFMLASWWPMVLGLGGLLGIVCLLLAVGIVQEARRPKTLGEAVNEAIVDAASRSLAQQMKLDREKP